MYRFIPRQHTDKATRRSALDLVKHFVGGKHVCCHNLALLFITARSEATVLCESCFFVLRIYNGGEKQAPTPELV